MESEREASISPVPHRARLGCALHVKRAFVYDIFTRSVFCDFGWGGRTKALRMLRLRWLRG